MKRVGHKIQNTTNTKCKRVLTHTRQAQEKVTKVLHYEYWISSTLSVGNNSSLEEEIPVAPGWSLIKLALSTAAWSADGLWPGALLLTRSSEFHGNIFFIKIIRVDIRNIRYYKDLVYSGHIYNIIIHITYLISHLLNLCGGGVMLGLSRRQLHLRQC